MKIILLDKIIRLGDIGDVVNVKSGFARNYLIPQKKAMFANEENIKIVEATTEAGFKKSSFVYNFMSSMRQKINDPLGQRAKKRKAISQR